MGNSATAIATEQLSGEVANDITLNDERNVFSSGRGGAYLYDEEY
jgi:hypothetical protein